MELYQRIKQRREELNLSQDDLAKRMGYRSRSTIAKIEAGKNDIPQSKIVAFAQALDTTPAYLMGYDNDLPVYNITNELLYLNDSFQSFPKLSKDRINSKEIYDAVNKIMDMNNTILDSPRTTWYFDENEALIGLKFLLCYYHINWQKYDNNTFISLIQSKIFKDFIFNILDTFAPNTEIIPNAAHSKKDSTQEENKQDNDIMDDDEEWK